MTRLLLLVLWFIRFLPLPWLARLGEGLGLAFYCLGRERRQITLTNLALCFPELDEAARSRLARRHFRLAGRSMLDSTVLSWSSARRIEKLVRLEGLEHLEQHRNRPVIALVPHFLGLNAAAIRLSLLGEPAVSVYRRITNPAIDRLMLHARTRFGDTLVHSRQDGIRPVIKAIKAGRRFFYLPDQDYGRRDAVFAPFFGVPAATVVALPRIARLTGASVLPCIARMLPGWGYAVRIEPAWLDFPGESVEQDTRRMNAYIEERVREMPEQYLWMHRRFKTRPRGEPSLYSR
jgi:Kdo2-lipid IVA lauroyltransferase/acyltransferase